MGNLAPASLASNRLLVATVITRARGMIRRGAKLSQLDATMLPGLTASGRLEPGRLKSRTTTTHIGITHGTCGRYRPRNHELRRRSSRRWRANGYRQRGGVADYSVRRGLRQER